MKPIAAGAHAEIEVFVTDDMTATLGGVEIHRVYSTFWLAHHAEVAARHLLEQFLEPHEQGIGAGISLRHLAPSPVGSRVHIRASFESFDGTRLVCRIEARNDKGICADGSQTQVVLPREKLEEMLKRAEIAPSARDAGA